MVIYFIYITRENMESFMPRPMFNGWMMPPPPHRDFHMRRDFHLHREFQPMFFQSNYGCYGGNNAFSTMGNMLLGACLGLGIASLFAPKPQFYGPNMQPQSGFMPEFPTLPEFPPLPEPPKEPEIPIPTNNLPTLSKDNVGAQFDNWAQSNTLKYENGEKVEDFAIVGDDYAEVVKKGDMKSAENIYKKGLMKLSKDTIALQDTSGDGKISYEEFRTKELIAYKNADSSITGVPLKAEEKTRKTFANIDIDGNGFIDEKEEAALYSLYDKNTDVDSNGKPTVDSGNINGKIRMKDFKNHSASMSDAETGTSLKQQYTFLFG